MRIIKKSAKFYIFILLNFLLFASSSTFADIDESYQEKSPEELILLAEQLRFTHLDKANSALMDAYNIATKNEDHANSIEVLLLQAKIAISQKDYYLAQQYLHRSENILKTYDNVNAKVRVLSAMADVKRYLKLFDESQEYIDEAIELARLNQQDDLMFIALEIKGALDKSRKRYKEALKTFVQQERYSKGMPDQDVMRLYRNFASMYSKVDEQESSARYYAKGIKLLEKMGNTRDLPENILDLAVTYRKMSMYDKALEKANEALTLARNYQDEINELRALVVISVIYRRLSSYEEALSYAIEAYTIYEKNNNYNGLASAANSIGLIYKRLGQYENAKNYFERVIDLPEKDIQLKFRASALREMGSILFTEGDNEAGIKYSQNAYNLFMKIGDNNGVATVNKNLGRIYQAMGDVDKAVASYTSAKEIFINGGDVWNEGVTLSSLATVLAKSDPKQAIKYAEESLVIAEDIQGKIIFKSAYTALIDAHEALKNYKSALKYARLKEGVVENIKEEAMSKRIAEIYIVLDMEKKEKELQNFKRQQAITSLELNRKQAALDILNKEKEISALENKNTLFTIAITITLMLLIYIVYRRKSSV